MLARGELRAVGATTLDEYRKHIEKDAALERRFQPVFVGRAVGRGHDRDPARAEGALRGAPRRAHPGLGDRRRGTAVLPLHRGPVPARQGDRPDRRGRVAAAHRDRLDADRDRRGRAAHPAARDRAAGAGEGARRRIGRAPRGDPARAGRPARALGRDEGALAVREGRDHGDPRRQGAPRAGAPRGRARGARRRPAARRGAALRRDPRSWRPRLAEQEAAAGRAARDVRLDAARGGHRRGGRRGRRQVDGHPASRA